MRLSRFAALLSILPMPIGVLASCATSSGSRAGVRLIGAVETVSADSLSSDAPAGKYASLAKIDPRQPLAGGGNGQTLALFGREDLIAANSRDHQPSTCAPSSPGIDVLDEIARRARATSIVIVNESHQRSEHRGFIAEVAGRLRPLGYATLAMETLTNNPPTTPERFRPTFLKQPGLPYLADDDGYYLSEAGFGRLGRRAKALGYRLLPYEFFPDVPRGTSPGERIAAREEAQATGLASFLKAYPGAKLLIHVGYSHAAEVPRDDGARWMAARLKEKTGIDPLTISQTTCRGGGDTRRLAALPATEPAGTFDLVVDHPAARFVRGRPEWRMQAGDRAVDIPPALRPTAGWRVIEARPERESITSVPMDRVAIRPGEDIALMLPPGRYRLRAIDVTPAKP